MFGFITDYFSTKKSSDDMLTRSARDQCWNARDVYFSCLDSHDVISPNSKNAKDICTSEKNKYNENCAISWVRYFNDKRLVDYKKKKLMEENENVTFVDVNPALLEKKIILLHMQ
ncbi:hypothetical protein TBLA_0B02760 [Henningerozyma blattae CBS 6284]|uniref:Cytochrome c oxidase assembly factor 6 n=1 Tax=Henningerozyma blattae (strain ATCC 34711 / CBS 6284 / DSM 70876 / NBRC 10599 / NRRL Y-10934 / UCD 77-7) TaxID=1071380 RepID=I2GYB6_HENB6|nr:hypothetical protein TBLA_0B02760 [Tetrapisispora blattae CBS 6284]CCH59118.1 hypothetical protein TBLA_0B02760 [Tetrapisispora blattae CBS 6284]